jgi:hypothetical protein
MSETWCDARGISAPGPRRRRSNRRPDTVGLINRPCIYAYLLLHSELLDRAPADRVAVPVHDHEVPIAVLDPVRTPPEGIGHFGEVKASAVLVLEDRVIHLEGDRYLHLNRPPVA